MFPLCHYIHIEKLPYRENKTTTQNDKRYKENKNIFHFESLRIFL